MRNVTILLVSLLVVVLVGAAGMVNTEVPVVGAKPFPVKFICQTADPELGAEVCGAFYNAFERNEFVKLEYDEEWPYFVFLVLPVEAEGTISITVTSNFVYPPFQGLSLSAFAGNFMSLPGQFDAESADLMTADLVRGTSLWLVRNFHRVIRVCVDGPNVEARHE